MNNIPSVDLSIILCCLNEYERLPQAILNLENSLLEQECSFEIIIIDNGSTDGTIEYIDQLDQIYIRKILNPRNIGKGGSIKKGIRQAQGEFCGIFDPDLEYSATDFLNCYDYMKQHNCDFVLGSRKLGGDKVYEYYLNYLGVTFLANLTNILYQSNLTDTATATKLFRSSFIKKINLQRNGFNLDFELVCRTLRMGGKIKEFPITYSPRTKIEGKKIKLFRDGFSSILTVIIDRFIPLRFLKK